MMTDGSFGGTDRQLAPLALALALLLGLPAVVRAAEEPDRSEAFAEETTVLAVEVPVRVLRDGAPVRGLSAENFAVFDEGEERPITSFQVLDLEEVTVEEASERGPDEVPPSARRHFLLLFDLDFTDVTYLRRAHEGARELLERGLEPTDLVAVAFFSQRAGVSGVLGFTPDRSQVAAALDDLGRYLGEDGDAPGGARGRRDVLGMTSAGWEAARLDLGAAVDRERSLAAEALDWHTGGGGRAPDGVGETLADMAAFASEDMQQKRAARASSLVAGLHRLADQYRWIDGQKYLVFFSMGFESDLYLDDGGSWLLREMREMLDGFRRTGWQVYSIEGVPLNTANARSRRESLAFLAKESGGTMVSGRNDLAVSMARVLAQTSVTYVLGFQSPELPADGSFRELRVELRGVPRGTRIHHRTGYHLPRPFAVLTEAERRVESAELLLAGREIEELDAALFAAPMERTEAGALVPVVVEIDRESLLAGPTDRNPGAEIHAYAFDLRGTVVDVSAPRVEVEEEKLAGLSGLKLFAELTLPPGRYDVRLMARSLRTGWVHLRRMPLEIPGDGDGRSLLAAVFVQGTQERWLLVRQPRPGGGEDAYPFTFEGERYLPAARAIVPSWGEARLLLIGYGIGAEEIVLESRMVDRLGTPLEGPTVTFLARTLGDAARPDQVVLSLLPEGAAPGDYSLELTLEEPDGRRIGTLRAPVRVPPE